MSNEILRLPAYPSTQSRKALSASQRATLNQTIASTLATVLALPPVKRDTQSTRDFLTSYARDTAFQTLQALAWHDADAADSPGAPRAGDERLIAQRSLLLAEKLAQTPRALELQTLLDLAVVYAHTQPTALRRVFATAHAARPALATEVATDLIPSLTALLAQQTPGSQGLYAQRKLAACVLAFLRGARGTPELLRPFAHSTPFVLALAALYDGGMAAIAAAYGGAPALAAGIAGAERGADEWEAVWVATKVALLDAFHIVLGALVGGLAGAAAGPFLAAEAERAFDVIFALLDAPAPAPSARGTTPFLDRPLLADYQQAYSLSTELAKALAHAQEKDARLDVLEAALHAFDAPSGDGQKPPGALKILLRSSGVPPGIDNRGTRGAREAPPAERPDVPDLKGKGRAPAPDAPDDPELDILATQVLDVLPDTPLPYARQLLAHDRYGRDPERVVAALLEGTAPSADELARDLAGPDADAPDVAPYHQQPQPEYRVEARANVFDDEALDVSRLHVGKRTAEADDLLRDRAAIAQMKADILRRAEAVSEDEEEVTADIFGAAARGKGKARAADLGPEEDEDAGVALRVAGDGEDSDDDDGEDDGAEEVQTPEHILELAYLRDPALFERDPATRRSTAWADLKAQTGWGDEQIEGWKIMLERNPVRKEKMAEKHAFRGNEKGLEVRPGGGGGGHRGRGGSRGGRGRGGGGGGGRGGGQAGGAGAGEGSARERAWKDKNKASRGNHNRKRGHDKKMARAGATAGPST